MMNVLGLDIFEVQLVIFSTRSRRIDILFVETKI
jgi:hypothetical protein